jgi:PelA/Pel-15E family pectate lyase
MNSTIRTVAVALAMTNLLSQAAAADGPQVTREQALSAMKKAAEFYTTKVAKEGGYHFYYASDLSYGRSEHADGLSQIEVQREATPVVGLAFLSAWKATGNRFYLDAARQAAMALVKGQHCSGGWDYIVEFDPAKRNRYPYRIDRNCAATKKPQTVPASEWSQPYTTMDDNVTQAAVRLLMRVDRALEFKDEQIHEATRHALDRLIEAQYPNGAWPQRFFEPPDPAKYPVKRASYPESWSRVWPGPDYRHLYTFNDNTISDLIDMFLEAARIYNEPKYKSAAEKGGGFILLAQMPDPQPAWAQQYDINMHPAWARIFEPPSVTGGESQGIIKTLLVLYRETGDKKYLEPIPRALSYLKKSILTPKETSGPARSGARFRKGTPVLARFYELRTNNPLYITKGTRVSVTGRPTALIDGYELSHSDESVIRHYAVVTSGAQLGEIEREYQRLVSADPASMQRPLELEGLSPWMVPYEAKPSKPAGEQIASMIKSMDERGAWVEEGTIGKTGRIVSVFAAKDMTIVISGRSMPLKENETVEIFEGTEPPRDRIIRSATFARNLQDLSSFVLSTTK